MAHLQKKEKERKNNKIEFEFMFARRRGKKGKRIMMFVSMVNSRFYVHVFLLVKLPLQKLLLFLIISVANENKKAA
jgi:hypothetical protein